MVRALLVLCCSEIEMQILLSRPTSEFSHSLGQIRPSCSIAVYGSSSSDSCRSSRMPATAESGQEPTSLFGGSRIQRSDQRRNADFCAPDHTLCGENYGNLAQFEHCDGAHLMGWSVHRGAP